MVARSDPQTTKELGIKVGQIWQEVDDRFIRFVRVEFIQNEWCKQPHAFVDIVTVKKNSDNEWVRSKGSRLSPANTMRFNGKKGGYRYVPGQN